MALCLIFLISKASIPLLSLPIATALVIFQIFQERRFNGYGESIGLVRPYRDKAGRHLETMHISGNVTRQIGNLMRVKVVGRIEIESPVFGRLDIPVKTQRMSKPVIVFVFVPVKITIRQAHAIIE